MKIKDVPNIFVLVSRSTFLVTQELILHHNGQPHNIFWRRDQPFYNRNDHPIFRYIFLKNQSPLVSRSWAGLGVEFVSRKFLFSIDVPLAMVRFSVNLSSDEPIVGDGWNKDFLIKTYILKNIHFQSVNPSILDWFICVSARWSLCENIARDWEILECRW